MNGALPEGWGWSTIGEVADVQLGRQRSPEHHQGEQMRPYLRSANVTWDGISLDDVKEMNFDDADFEKYRLEPGDLLVNEASGSPSEVGKPAIWEGELDGCCFQNTLLRLRPDGIDLGYLFWYCYFAALTGRFGEAGRGVNIRHLGKRGLARFPIPVPPCADQKWIVSAIEEQVSRLDAAAGLLATASARHRILMQAVIDGSVVGEALRLGDHLAEPLRNGLSAARSEDGDTRVLTLTAVTNRSFVTENTKLAVVPSGKRESLMLKSGDLLVQRSNTPELVGTAALYQGPEDWAIYPDLLIRVRPDSAAIVPEYLELALRSSGLRNYFRQAAQGIAGSMPKISQATIEEARVPAPRSVSEQTEAAQEATRQLDALERTGLAIHTARRQVSALRRSALGAAFSGAQFARESERFRPVGSQT